tara:strand:- start:148 stop:336 length:189 start_codon:yes stop_codon:yes gene_type:complete
MAHLIKKPSALGTDTVYYAGGTRWSDNRSEAQSFVDEAAANAVMVNTDGTNGGWTGATTETV